MKKYLGCFSILNHETLKMNDRLLYIAEQMNTNIFKDTIETNSQRELLLNIVDSFYAESYLTESVNEIEILKANGQQYTYNEESDAYTLVTECSELPKGLCLGIDNIATIEIELNTSQGAPNLDIFVKSWNEKGDKKLYTKQEDMGIGWGLKVGDNLNPTISQVDLLKDNGFLEVLI